MHQLERDIPHVLSKQDGLRSVDILYDFQSPEEFEDFLSVCTLIATGKNAFVFTEPASDTSEAPAGILRLDLLNVLGYEWNKQFIPKLQERYPNFAGELEELANKNEWYIKPKSARAIRDDSACKLRTRIAAHNSAFRRNPINTLPINTYYSFHGKPLALSMPYLEGNTLHDAQPGASLNAEEEAVLRDSNTKNVIVGIKNMVPQRVIVDISSFTPSDQPLQGETIYSEK